MRDILIRTKHSLYIGSEEGFMGLMSLHHDNNRVIYLIESLIPFGHSSMTIINHLFGCFVKHKCSRSFLFIFTRLFLCSMNSIILLKILYVEHLQTNENLL